MEPQQRRDEVGQAAKLAAAAMLTDVDSLLLGVADDGAVGDDAADQENAAPRANGSASPATLPVTAKPLPPPPLSGLPPGGWRPRQPSESSPVRDGWEASIEAAVAAVARQCAKLDQHAQEAEAEASRMTAVAREADGGPKEARATPRFTPNVVA